MARNAVIPGSLFGAVSAGDCRCVLSVASGNYSLPETEVGVVMATAGTTATLPAYTSAQNGRPFVVKNGSTGAVTVAVASGEGILRLGQLVTSLTIPSDFSRTFLRVSSSPNSWVIV